MKGARYHFTLCDDSSLDSNNTFDCDDMYEKNILNRIALCHHIWFLNPTWTGNNSTDSLLQHFIYAWLKQQLAFDNISCGDGNPK